VAASEAQADRRACARHVESRRAVGAFDSGTLGQGDSFRHTFTTAEIVAYICAFRPTMAVSITVTA
jgi:hypothetical protein